MQRGFRHLGDGVPAAARIAWVAFLGSIAGRAQDAPPASDAGAQPVLAQVVVDQVPVRCFASDGSPVFLDSLRSGEVVQAGEVVGEFRSVRLPLGVTGYVHKNFASAPDDEGFVRAAARRVSFRYRPQSGEAPVALLDQGSAMHLMGEHEDWWLVRSPMVEGWLPVAALVVDAEGATLASAWSAFELARRSEWQRVVTERREAAKAKAELAAVTSEVEKLVASFRAEAGKPWRDQSRQAYVALEGSLDKLRGRLPSGSAVEITAASLGREIERQKLVLDAQAVAEAELPPPEAPKAPAKIEDPFARFDLVGWVKVVSSAVPGRSVRLMRGGRVLGYLTCSADRYDLPLFDGVEVGVIGAKAADLADGAWQLDVQRLEVLSVADR